jgi:WD40 repeat protein
VTIRALPDLRVEGAIAAGGPVDGVALRPDGRHVAAALGTRNARIWEVEGGALVRGLGAERDKHVSVTYSPDGARLVTTSRKAVAMVWNATTGAPLAALTGHNPRDRVNASAFSGDGARLVTGANDHSALIWDPASGRVLVRFSGHSGGINSVAFDGAARRVATSSFDGRVRLWDAGTGAPLFELEHGHHVSGAVFSPDGALVASTGVDGATLLWDAEAGRLLARFQDHTGRAAPPVFVDARTLMTGGDDDRLVVRDVSSYSGSAAELGAQLACRVPFEVKDGRLVPRAVAWSACAGVSGP